MTKTGRIVKHEDDGRMKKKERGKYGRLGNHKAQGEEAARPVEIPERERGVIRAPKGERADGGAQAHAGGLHGLCEEIREIDKAGGRVANRARERGGAAVRDMPFPGRGHGKLRLLRRGTRRLHVHRDVRVPREGRRPHGETEHPRERETPLPTVIPRGSRKPPVGQDGRTRQAVQLAQPDGTCREKAGNFQLGGRPSHALGRRAEAKDRQGEHARMETRRERRRRNKPEPADDRRRNAPD